MARPARAVRATIRSCGNGAAPSPSCAAVPVQPNIALFSGVSATFTSIPSAAHTVIPASSTADGSPSLTSGPAARQNRASIRSGGHQHPPARDDFLRGHVPFQGERDVREQPGQRVPAPRNTRRPASGSSRASAG